jgi:hypothetical protein
MSMKLTLEDLAVTSFAPQQEPAVGLASTTDSPNECGNTQGDPCFSVNPVCSHDCIEPSRRTNIAYCCG